MTAYDNYEIMTGLELEKSGLSPFFMEYDEEEIYFVRWTTHNQGSDVSVQSMDSILDILDKLEEMFG